MIDQLDTATQAVFENIRQRRTVPYKKMKRDLIDRETLMMLFEAANWAPTHKFTEPWRFQVFTGESRRALGEALQATYRAYCGEQFMQRKYDKLMDRCMHVPATAAIIMDPSERHVLPEYEEILAIGCAMQNLHLAAQSLGIGGMWSTPGYINHEVLREFLNLESRMTCFGFFYMGYVEGPWPESKRGPIAEKVMFVEEASNA